MISLFFYAVKFYLENNKQEKIEENNRQSGREKLVMLCAYHASEVVLRRTKYCVLSLL